MSDMSDLDQIPDPLREHLHALRARYADTDPPEAAPSVAVFFTAPTAAGGMVGSSLASRSRSGRVIGAFGAFVGTLTGKIVLGAAIAGASIAAGQATGVVDVPGLPDRPSSPAPPAEHRDESPPAADQTPMDDRKNDNNSSTESTNSSSDPGDGNPQSSDDGDVQTGGDHDSVGAGGTTDDRDQQNVNDGTSGPEDDGEDSLGRGEGGPSDSAGDSGQPSSGDDGEHESSPNE